MEASVFALAFLFLLLLVINALFVLATAFGAFYLLVKNGAKSLTEKKPALVPSGVYEQVQDHNGNMRVVPVTDIDKQKTKQKEIDKMVEEWTLTSR